MRKSLIFSVSLALFYLGMLLFTPTVFAQEYTVKSVIIIPPDWQGRISKEQLDTYKTGIINGLGAVRQLYATTLSGKTFQFDRNIEVAASKEPIEKVEERLMLDRDYRSSFYTNVFPERQGVVYIAWGIGTKNGVRRGDPVSKDFGFVWLKHQDILGLSADSTEDERKWSLSMLAHELGHAFGLVFAGYAEGHPCTEESPQECSVNTPRPYPGPYEWASIMGYGTPYLSFPNLFFNNTVYNPEIQKILKSPFVNPNGDPAPSPIASQGGQKQQSPVFFELSPGTIIAGQNFAIKGVNLENFRQFEIRRKDLSAPQNKDRLQDAKMVDNNGSTIKINIAEDAVPANSDSSWEIKLLDGKGASLTVPDELNIKGKDAASGMILAADIAATCGPDKKAVQAAPVRLQTRNGTTLAQVDTQVDGTAILNYTVENPSNKELALVAGEIQGIVPTSDNPGTSGTSSKDITVPNSSESFTASASFNYPECPSVCNPKITFLCGGMGDAAGFPGGHTVKITPNCTNTNLYGEGLASKEDLGDRGECAAGVVVPSVTAGLPTPVEKVSSRGTTGGTLTDSQGTPIGQASDTYTGLTADIAGEGTKIIISNYPDFRPQNEEGDIGSPTIIVEPGSKVTWTLSTLGSADDRQVSVAEITNGNRSKETPYFVGDGGIIEAGGAIIKTEKVKNFVTKYIVTVNGIREELTADRPSLSVRLNGTEGTPQAFNIPYEIYYAESAKAKEDRLPLNYQPPRQCECPYSNPCTTADGQSGTQECQGVYEYTAEGRQCSFDQSGGCTPACRECNAVPPSPEPEVSAEPEASPEPGISSEPSEEPAPVNYCEEAGYYLCTPDQPVGTCTAEDGRTCTAYSTYQCNFGGQNYCDNSRCLEPCEPPPPQDCGEMVYQNYDPCIACNWSHPVYMDSCGNTNENDTSKDHENPTCNTPELCGLPPDQVCEPNSEASCEIDWGKCADGSTCATGIKYCNGDGTAWGDCQVATNDCDTQCQPKVDCGDAGPPYPLCGKDIQEGSCTGTPFPDQMVVEVTRTWDANCSPVYSCNPMGYFDNQCGYNEPQPSTEPGGGPPPKPDYNPSGECGYVISWGGSDPEVTYVDISEDSSFGYFYNKYVAGQTGTDAPGGFTSYPNGDTPLVFKPNTTYYVRLYNGYNDDGHGPTNSFTTPGTCGGNCQPGAPLPFDENRDCIGCNLSQQFCTNADCSEYLCVSSQDDNRCSGWCNNNPPPPGKDCPDAYYCEPETGTTWHSYGGYYDEAAGKCIWNYEDTGEPC